MKKILYSFLILFIGGSTPVEGQIFEKLVKKVTKEVLKEVTSEDDKVESNPQETTGVILTPEKVEGAEKGPSVTKSAAAGTESSFKAATTKQVLGTLGNFILFSPDGKYVAHTGMEGSRQVMLVNGEAGPLLDDVITSSLKFSAEGGHYAYVGKKDGECILFLDGKELSKVSCNNQFGWAKDIIFSQDGSIVANYNKLPNGSNQVMINGKPGPESSHTPLGGLMIRGNTVFYSGKVSTGTGSESYLYKNHKPELFHGEVMISNDGETIAYAVYENNKKYVVVNGKKQTEPSFLFVEMDPTTGAVYCTGTQDVEQMLWKGKTFSLPEGERLAKFSKISPDGKNIVYISFNDSGRRLWVDAKPGPFFKEILDVQFTGDGKKLIYIVNSGGKNFVVVNDETLGPFDKASDLQVSDAGGAYTFVFQKGNSNHRYLNGKDLGDLGDVQHFTFSPDGSRNAAKLNREKAIFLDGKKVTFPDFQSLDNFEVDPQFAKLQPFVFSPKGNRLAITYKREVKTKNEAVLLLDDQKFITDRNNGGHAYPTFSPDGKHFAFLTKVRGEGEKYYWQLYIDMKPGPIVGGMKNAYVAPPQNITLKFLEPHKVQVIGVIDQEIVKHTVSIN